MTPKATDQGGVPEEALEIGVRSLHPLWRRFTEEEKARARDEMGRVLTDVSPALRKLHREEFEVSRKAGESSDRGRSE